MPRWLEAEEGLAFLGDAAGGSVFIVVRWQGDGRFHWAGSLSRIGSEFGTLYCRHDTMHAPDEVDQFEEDLRILKNKYDQFFAGIRKLPPNEDRRRLDTSVHELSRLRIRDNGKRFRFNTLVGRYSQYRELWARRMREREEGPIEFKKRAAALDLTVPALHLKPQAAARPETSEAPDPYVRMTRETSDAAVQQIYARISDEQRKLGKGPGLTIEQVAAMVEKQSETLRERYQVQAIAFRVETVDGKVKIKAKPVQP